MRQRMQSGGRRSRGQLVLSASPFVCGVPSQSKCHRQNFKTNSRAYSAIAIPRCGPASPFKGHLSTRSNAFCIDSSRNLTSQYLIRDHMVFHYDRILSAKAAVDCSVPKSRMSSIKFADQQRRERLKKKIAGCEEKMSICETVSRTCSRDGRMPLPSSFRKPSGYIDKRLLKNKSQCLLKQMMQRILPSSNRIIAVANTKKTFLEAEAGLCPCARQAQYLSTAPSPCGERGLVHSSSVKYTRKCSRNSSRASSSSSNVCTSRPPSKRSGISCSHSMDSFVSVKCSRGCQANNPKESSGDLLERHSQYFTKSRKPFTPRTLKSDAKSFLSEYRYYTPARRRKKNHRKLRVEAQTQTDMISFSNADGVYVRNITTEKQRIKSKVEGKRCTLDEPERGTDAFCNSMLRDTSRYPQKSSPRSCIEAEEEELLYLTFIEDVTNEILNLGLFSNRVLDQLFECHIEENKNRLDEAKMRRMLDMLKSDLGCGMDSETELIHEDQEALDSPDLQESDTGEELEFTSKGHRLRKGTKSEEFFESMDSSLKEPNKCESLSCSERSRETQSREDFSEGTTEMMDAATESDFCGVEFEEHPGTSPTCEAALNSVASDSDLEVSKELEPEESFSTCERALNSVASDSDLEVNKELDEPEESFSTCEGALNFAASDSDLEVNKELDELGESFSGSLHISHNYAQ